MSLQNLQKKMFNDIQFHKSCYTSRSPGYKYRTLATNTGDKKRRDSKEDSTFDSKYKEVRSAIVSRIEKHFEDSELARQKLFRKFEMIDAKINSMLELQNTVRGLRKNLTATENALMELQERVDKLDTAPSSTTTYLTIPRTSYTMTSSVGSNVTRL